MQPRVKPSFLFVVLFAILPSFEVSFAYTPAFTRNGNLIRWDLDELPQGQPNIIENGVEFFISRLGTVDLEDNGDGTGGEFDVLRSAFGVWQEQPSSNIRFNDLKLTDQRGIRGWDETNIILFDETNETGLFPPGTGVIAFTLTTYEDEQFDGVFDGRIRDTDLVFNGRDFAFSSGLEPNKINLLAVTVHEVGHVSGLDHSFHQKTNRGDDSVNVHSMYPFLGFADDRAAHLSQDDISGLIELYTNDEFVRVHFGSIYGLAQLGGEPVPGVDVIAYRDGFPIASTITRPDGTYRIHGVPEGKYILKADVLSPANVYPALPLSVDFHSQYSIKDGIAGLSSDASTVTVYAGKRHPGLNFALTHANEPDFFEPNDGPGESTLLASDGTAMIHQHYREGDEDWVRFQGVQGIIYELATDNLSFFADPIMRLYGSDGATLLAENDDINSAAGNFAARIRFTSLVAGTYFVRLADALDFFGAGTSYEFSIQEIGAAKLDSNSDGRIDTLDLFAFSKAWTAGEMSGKGAETGSILSTDLLIDLIHTLAR